jgi:hypothetical protein
MGARPIPIWATLCALALVLTLATPAVGAVKPAKKKHHVPPPPELALTPSLTSSPGASVSMPPVGVSLEYPVMAQDLGSGTCPPPALTAELQRLGSPPLQLAGQSQDFTVPAGAQTSSTPNWEALTTYSLPSEFWTRLHCLLSTTGEPLTVGLNARTGQLSWAEQMVAAATATATNGLGFSIGNEPDLYYLPDFASLDKPQTGEEPLDANLYLRTVAALRPAIGAAPLTGPELSGPARWQATLPGVISAMHVQTVGVHVYPLSVCKTPRAATIPGLLSASVGDAPSRLAWVVSDADAAGAAPVITEANSVSCGGKSGVSDSPASAVWAVRFVLAALRTGFREVRFHFSGDPYDPFYVRGTEVVRHPIEGAMSALNQWLPLGATLRSVPGVKGLNATAVAVPGGQSLLILDNESAKTSKLVLRGGLGLRTEAFVPRGSPGGVGPLPHGGATRKLAVIPAESILAIHFQG